MSEVFRLTENEKKGLEKSGIARFLAGIPYGAGCSNADRKAFSYLSMFILSSRDTGKYSAPNKEDDRDIMNRMELFVSFPDGDREYLTKVHAQISLVMLEDYKTDMEIDMASGQHNPLNTGAWDYNKEKTRLNEIIESIDKETRF